MELTLVSCLYGAMSSLDRTTMSRKNGGAAQESMQLELFPPTPFLTIEEVAELMKVPKSFIYRRTCRGHDDPIPSFRFGGHLRFRLDEIQDWIAKHRVAHDGVSSISDVPVRRAVAAAKDGRRSRQQLRRGANSVKSGSS